MEKPLHFDPGGLIIKEDGTVTFQARNLPLLEMRLQVFLLMMAK
jgi:hypothetical protein